MGMVNSVKEEVMKLYKNILIVLTSLVILAGCASEKKKKHEDAAPHIPTVSGPGQEPGDDWQWGGTAKLNIQNIPLFSEYTTRPMNNPTQISINVNLTKYGQDKYGGYITIGYYDNIEGWTEGYFTSGTTEREVQYNVWLSNDDFHGFFQDDLGALILVITPTKPGTGDGQRVHNIAKGSVWFKNFGLTYAPKPPTKCWFVSLGPYDCRAWKTKRGVETERATDPDSGYRLLGTFNGLNLKKAFNNEIEVSEDNPN